VSGYTRLLRCSGMSLVYRSLGRPMTWSGSASSTVRFLELYGPANEFHAFFTTGPVVAFRVENFDVMRGAMLAAGVNFIGDVQHADGVSWQHFYCPDGTVLEISGPGDGANTPAIST
jgi:hypothetical protein